MPGEAKRKFIIVSGTKIAGKHVNKGAILELDPDNKPDANLIASLNHAGRIALATPEVVDQIRAEIEAEEDAAPAPKVKRQVQQQQQS